jgi:D-alanine transaminase
VPNVAYLDGKYSLLGEARVSVMDRGFLFGDGIYEVIRATAGWPFLLEEHLRRLEYSARMIALALPSRALFRQVIARLLPQAGYAEASVYIQVTRGVDFPRRHTYPPPGTPPTVLVAVWEMHPWTAEQFTRGIACVTAEDVRWGRCDVKSINLLPNCMGRELARRRGAAEVIFVKNGLLVEGGMSAVFAARRGRLLVPELSREILPSLTRALVLKIAKRKGLTVELRPVTVKELFAANEVFLASTTAEGLAVVKIDGRRIGRGKPGRMARLMHEEIVALRLGRAGR